MGKADGVAGGWDGSECQDVASSESVSVMTGLMCDGVFIDFFKRYNHPYDVHLVGFTELLRIMWRFHEQVYSDPKAPTGLNKVGFFIGMCDEINKGRATTLELRF